MSKIIKYLVLSVLILQQLGVQAHQKIIIDLGQQKIEGGINHMLPVNIPLGEKQTIPQMIHSASTTISDDQKYLVVYPATVYPSALPLATSIVLPTNAPSLLQQLRTYRTSHYRDMVIFPQNYSFFMLNPNKIVVFRQQATILSGMGGKQSTKSAIQNTYTIDGITGKTQTKMYKIKSSSSQPEALLVTNTNTVYKLSKNQYMSYTLDEPLSVSHLQFVANNVFVAAQNGRGIGFYQVQSNGIRTISKFSCEDLGFGTKKDKKIQQNEITDNQNRKKEQIQKMKSLCYISDISYNATNNKIYFLDSKSGLYEAVFPNVKQSLSLLNKGTQYKFQLYNIKQISQIKDCDALDLVSEQHIVLICQIGLPSSYIQELVLMDDPLAQINNNNNKSSSSENKNDSKNKIFIKKDPIYHKCNFNDLIVTEDFFLAFDSYNIDVFWNSMKFTTESQFGTEHTKQHFNLPGLQLFTVKKVPAIKNAMNSGEKPTWLLYVIQSNMLMIYTLNIFPGKIYAYSPIPVQKTFKVQVPAKCPSQYPTLTLNRQFNKNMQCLKQITIHIDIKQRYLGGAPTRQKVSMSVGLIVIMLAVLAILTWICLAKYKGLEKHARKILDKYRQRSRYQQNKFTI